MALLDKVMTNVNCCGIEVAFAGISIPSIITGWQPFYNQTFKAASFSKAYASISKINFSEESVTTTAGTYFKQKIDFQFPTTDSNRAERIALLHKIRFIKVLLDDGSAIVIGRNDITQNAFPGIKSKSNQHIFGIEIETHSISPAGFTTITNTGIPVYIPITMTGYYQTFIYLIGDLQDFDLGAIVTPISVVLNEGRELKQGTEWTISGTILTVIYPLEDGDNIYVSGLEN